MSKIDVPRIIAHRGASGHAPENTAAAIRKAHELGAPWVEFDCMLSKDGRVFLNHDETLERTAGVNHRACDLELADLVHLDVGSWFSADYAGETIPTFRDTMILLSELGMGANVEIKPCKGFEAATGAAVAKEIDSHWPADIPPPVVSSFSKDSLVAAIPLLGSEWRSSGAESLRNGVRNLPNSVQRPFIATPFGLRRKSRARSLQAAPPCAATR
jgi:glycerophosphoryl diester phosphodiesterase